MSNPKAEDMNTDPPSPPPSTDGTTVAPGSRLQSREGSLGPPPFDELPGLLSSSFIDSFNVATPSSSSSLLATPTTASATVPPVPTFTSSTSPADSTMDSLLSYLTNGDPPSDAPFADIFDSTLHDLTRDKDSRNICLSGPQTQPGECGCLSEAANYYAVLELSVRLRRVAEVLNRHPPHGEGSMCLLRQRIADLDDFTRFVCCPTWVANILKITKFVSATLGSADTPGMSRFPQAQPSNAGRTLCSGCASPEAGWTGGSVAFAMSPGGVHPRTLVTPSRNSLTSWTPHQRWNLPSSATGFDTIW